MKKAILIGNGMTSQLINEYKDSNMIKKIKSQLGSIYEEIDSMLDPFRKLKDKSKENIISVLENIGIESHHYYRYFIEQSLIVELDYEHITALETLLKVAHLFHHIKEFDYTLIKNIANNIYYNDGNNGIESINTNRVNIDKFRCFINQFDFVYTTNFDNILDDIYDDEVYHLHGGFKYEKINSSNGSISIIKNNKELSPEKAYLIWGRNSEEKMKETQGGFRFPIRFPFNSGYSVLNDYFNSLERNKISELHIWGYSGLNDGHINDAIIKNNNIKEIFCYVDLRNTLSKECNQKLNKLYNKKNDKDILIKSWNEIWDLLI